MLDDFDIPEPSPAVVQLVAAIARHVLSGLGALGIGLGSFGTVTDSNLLIAAGALCWVAAAVWSLWQKWAAQRKIQQTALASARAGVPIEPTTQPPPP